MTIDQIKANWTDTDKIIYNNPETKLKSLQEANTKVISKI